MASKSVRPYCCPIPSLGIVCSCSMFINETDTMIWSLMSSQCAALNNQTPISGEVAKNVTLSGYYIVERRVDIAAAADNYDGVGGSRD